ncbi:hypothetical protein Stok01_02734 [Sulfurisphaera tokodaii]
MLKDKKLYITFAIIDKVKRVYGLIVTLSVLNNLQQLILLGG